MDKTKHSTLMKVAVPKGWKLVPIEPTSAMLLAGETYEYDAEIWWSLMLNAAPAGPVAAQAQQPVSGADQFRDAAKMIEPFGNSGEFEKFAGRKLMEAYKAGMHGKNFNIPEAVDSITRASMDQFRDAAQMIEPSGNSGELPPLPQGISKHGVIGHDSDVYTEAHMLDYSRAALAQQDADKVDAALAEMVHAMFRSANSIPVTRITIDRKQYEAAIDAAREEKP